ncbi:MAG: caspase family protein [Chloroflexota bacterium]
MPQTFLHGYALLIGVGMCEYANWSLPVTVHDAQALQNILTNVHLCAYPNDSNHLRFLHNETATRRGIMDGLAWLQAQTAVDTEATAVVYFSGHGWMAHKTGEYYLIPSDVHPFDIAGTAVSATVFTEALRRIEAKRLLVIIDSCHAEGMATAKDASGVKLPADFSQTAVPQRMITSLKQGEGRAVFTSSRDTQKSWVRPDQSMSIYTFHLIEALQGASNKPGETVVRLSNLMNYLSQTVPSSAQAHFQTAQIPYFEMATEDYAVALLQGGKGLPDEGWEAVKDTPSNQPTINIQGDGNIVGNHNISQIVQATGGSTISGVTQIAEKPKI